MISNCLLRGNYSIIYLIDDCSSLTGWTQYEVGDASVSQDTYDSRETFKLTGDTTEDAGISQTLSSISTPYWLLLNIYFGNIDNDVPEEGFEIQVYDGTHKLLVAILRNDVWIHNGTSWQEIVTGTTYENSGWWNFAFNVKDGGYVDTYIGESDANPSIVDTDAVIGENTNDKGYVYFAQNSNSTADITSYINNIIITKNRPW